MGTKTRRKDGDRSGIPEMTESEANNMSAKLFKTKHFQIKSDDKGCQFWISPNHKHASMSELIDHYKRGKGNNIHLTNICQRARPTINPNADKWEIDRADVQLGARVGGGNFGEVFKGMWRCQVEVAIKTLKDEQGWEEFNKEVEVLKRLHHPNLVQVFGLVSVGEPLMLVMEFLEKGDLRDYVQEHGKDLTEDQMISICENIANGMQTLEELKVVHRDLAARNVMLDKWGQAKVGDFGLARSGDEYENKAAKFPVKWTAPEAVMKKKFDTKSDVWSYGITMWEIFSFGVSPYPGWDNGKTIQELKRGYRMPMPNYNFKKKETNNALYNIMLRCWNKDPMKRPTFMTIHTDFVDFDSTCNQYDYAYSQYMEENGLTHEQTLTRSKQRGRGQRTDTPRLPAKPGRAHR